MTPRKYLPALTFPILLVTAVGCELLEPKTDLEKRLAKLTNEWSVDSVRVREYGYIHGTPAQTPLVRDTLFPIRKMKFARAAPDAMEGTLIQTSAVNGAEVITELRWRYYDYLEILYPNPNVGLSDVGVIFDVIELSDKNFHFERNENLVSETNGARYGSLSRVWKMHR